MAFFEDLGKMISDAGQGVAQQTKNFTEVSRLNDLISENETKISQLFHSLGQAYYERFKDDENAEDRGAIDEIKTLIEQTNSIKEEIRRIKGIRTCTECGAELAANAAFCAACGAKVVQPEVEEPTNTVAAQFCTNCGNPVVAGNMFCNNCGAKLG